MLDAVDVPQGADDQLGDLLRRILRPIEPEVGTVLGRWVPAGGLERRRLAVAHLEALAESGVGPGLGSDDQPGGAGQANERRRVALAEKDRIVRSAESSIIEITSPRRPANSAQAWAVLRSRSKSSISATHSPGRPSVSVTGLGGELTDHPWHPVGGGRWSPVLGSLR